MDKAELHQAFIWDCNSCGRENLERIIWDDVPAAEADDTDEDSESSYDYFEEVVDRIVICLPEVVVCDFCEASHLCTLPIADDDEEI